jgi:hypothetical protein
MWEIELPQSLVWIRARMDKRMWPTLQPDFDRAPSWSWASLNYPIDTRWSSESTRSLLVSQWKVLQGEAADQTSISLLTKNAKSISLTGPLVRAAISRKTGPALHRGIERILGSSYCISRLFRPHGIEFLEDESQDGTEEFGLVQIMDDIYNDVIFDDLESEKTQEIPWCAPIFLPKSNRPSTKGRIYGVLLDHVESNIFRRIGACSFSSEQDGRKLPPMPLTTYTII